MSNHLDNAIIFPSSNEHANIARPEVHCADHFSLHTHYRLLSSLTRATLLVRVFREKALARCLEQRLRLGRAAFGADPLRSRHRTWAIAKIPSFRKRFRRGAVR